MASNIRTGLEREPSHAEFLKFALILSTAFLALSGAAFYQGKKWFWLVGLPALPLLAGGVAVPGILPPIYRIWMGGAAVLGWVQTRIILIVIFYFVFTPLGIALRIFGTDLLDLHALDGLSSYWKERDGKNPNPQSYYKQY